MERRLGARVRGTGVIGALALVALAHAAWAGPPQAPPMLTASPGSTIAAPLTLTAGGSQTITITNADRSKATGALGVSLTQSPSTGGFQISLNRCSGVALGPRKTCTVTVSYPGSAPASTQTATLTIASKKPSASVSSYFTIAAAVTNHQPVATDDSFTLGEDDAFNAVNNTLSLGNVASNDSDQDNDTLNVTTVSNVSLDTSNGTELSGMTATLTNGTVLTGSPASISLTISGQSATVQIAADGSTTLFDPNHLFNALAAGESVKVTGSYTISDSQLTDSASWDITVNGADDGGGCRC